jgi:hypothetical protein
MKYSIIFFFLLAANSYFAQQKTNQKASLKSIEVQSESYTSDFAYHTPKKDTLFLAKNDLGKLLYKVWQMDKNYNGTNPVILFVDDIAVLKQKRKRWYTKTTTK